MEFEVPVVNKQEAIGIIGLTGASAYAQIQNMVSNGHIILAGYEPIQPGSKTVRAMYTRSSVEDYAKRYNPRGSNDGRQTWSFRMTKSNLNQAIEALVDLEDADAFGGLVAALRDAKCLTDERKEYQARRAAAKKHPTE